MKLAHLKKIRVAVSLVFFLFTLAVYIDFTGLFGQKIFDTITFLQFVPSVLNFFTILSFSAAGFIIVLLLAFLFGRVYCSSICPLGTLQDIISFVIRKIKKKKFYHYTKEYAYLRYSVLTAVLISTLTGFVLLLNLLDPFSNAGKIFTALFRPLFIYANNGLSSAAESIGIYSFYPYAYKGISPVALVYPVIFLITIIILVYNNGRLFCNTICPVGTLLGFFSKFSYLKLKIDESSCISCRLCERTCKSGCIDKQNKEIDFSRCVGCYNCLSVCVSDAIVFRGGFSKKDKPEEIKKLDKSKRRFISKSALAVGILSGINFAQVKISPKKKSTIPVKKNHPSTPPGSLSREHFSERCTACHLCISACPTQVLQPAVSEYGFLGLFQPVMDYDVNYCNYDCTVCGDVCPSGAIKSFPVEKKKLIQIGKAKFIKENCVVYTENTACGACSEHCPTKAVDMVPYKNIRIPEVTEEFCTGCGACEHACPTVPYKSIYVEGNPVHKTAKIRKLEKIEMNTEEDFPF